MRQLPGHLAITLNDVITDSTGGTPGTTFAAITAGAGYAQADMVAAKNAISSIAAENALLRTALSAIQTQINKLGDALVY